MLEHADGVPEVQKPVKNSQPDSNEGIAHNHSDRTLPRRIFLGAAGALAGIPLVADGATATAGGDDLDAPDDSEYGRRTVAQTAGGMAVFSDGNYQTDVRVSSHPEGVGLELSNEAGEMDVLLLPEAVDELCRALRDAQATTNPEDVADTREWISGDDQNGGA